MRSRATVQSPAGYAAQNLNRAGLRSRLQDQGWRYVIHPKETAAGLVEADLVFGFDLLDIRRYGPAGGGADDNIPIQRAINVAQEYAAVQGGAWVYVPPCHNHGYWRTAAPLTMHGLGIGIFGDGCGSVIINDTAGATVLEVGDDSGETDNNKVIGLNLGRLSSSVGSRGILARQAPNLLVADCNVQGVEDSLRATGIYCARIINNTFGGVTGWAMHFSNSSNSMIVHGNRADGASIAATGGIFTSGQGNHFAANTLETLDTMVRLSGERGSFFHCYGETYNYGYRCNASGTHANRLTGGFSSLGAQRTVYLEAGTHWAIDDMYCADAHVGGAPIQLTSGPSDVHVGLNVKHADARIWDTVINARALRHFLLSELLLPLDSGYMTLVDHTGTTAATVLKSRTLTRQHLGTGSRVRIQAYGNVIDVGGTKTIEILIAGVVVATVSMLAASTADWSVDVVFDVASATAGFARVVSYEGGALETHDVGMGGVTLALSTTDPVIQVRGTLGVSTDRIRVQGFSVDID
jgi:hypothetical protein